MYIRTPEEFKARYGYVINGSWYPRVTAICDIKAKPGLYKFYERTGSASGQTFQIFRYPRPLDKSAPRGDHSAAVEISFVGGGDLYCCESVACSAADFSNVLGAILYPSIGQLATRDKCLGKTCKFIRAEIVLKNPHNSSS